MTPTDAECRRCIRLAWEHIAGDAHGQGAKVLADATIGEFQCLMRHATVRRAEARLNAVALRGDVLATRQACQHVAKTYKTLLHKLRHGGLEQESAA